MSENVSESVTETRPEPVEATSSEPVEETGADPSTSSATEATSPEPVEETGADPSTSSATEVSSPEPVEETGADPSASSGTEETSSGTDETSSGTEETSPEPVVARSFERGRRKVREGFVVSDKMDKTVVVAVEDRVKHRLYGKVLRQTVRLKAHDEGNEAGVGDRVRIMETRPLSATKRWRLITVLEKAK